MAKRSRDGDDDKEEIQTQRALKRLRYNKVDRLSGLSDEVVIRILSFLDVHTLTSCQILSRRFGSLATDPQLWKAAFYKQFVRPRAVRIPGVSASSLLYSSKLAKWLDEDHLVKAGIRTNWKSQYKLRHNWATGTSNINNIEISPKNVVAPILVRVRGNIAVSVDRHHGLRAWAIKGSSDPSPSCSYRFEDKDLDAANPCSLAIDNSEDDDTTMKVAVGFASGDWRIYLFKDFVRGFSFLHGHPRPRNCSVTAVQLASPYLATIHGHRLLSIYAWSTKGPAKDHYIDPPRLITSLDSSNPWCSLSLSLRVFASGIVASVAYAILSWNSGWTVALQELRLDMQGEVLQSRIASAVQPGYAPLISASSLQHGLAADSEPLLSEHRSHNLFSQARMSMPMSLSYSHPYLLSAHDDNTLGLYLVDSSESSLSIGPCHRLWGHTAGLSDAHIGDRGRAVSTSAKSYEIRVWELEGSMSSRKRSLGPTTSVRINSGMDVQAPAGQARGFDRFSFPQYVAGFDQEKIVIVRNCLKSALERSSAMVIHDFS